MSSNEHRNSGRWSDDDPRYVKKKVVKDWLPTIVTLATVIGWSFTTVRDVKDNKQMLKDQVKIDARQDIQLTSHEEQLKSLAKIENNVEKLTEYFLSSRHRREDRER